jgi:glycosyltransferase
LKPTFSIITAVLNNNDFIEDAINSVLNQTYPHIEYIIIDGASTDGTLDIIKKYESRIKWVSEPDEGIYDALNKGIELSTGDIIGILHADDILASRNAIEKAAKRFLLDPVKIVYSDLVYVNKNNTNRVYRYWKAGGYKNISFSLGWMPPHPTLFVRREIYERYGKFNTGYKIAADYDLILRFLGKHKISAGYVKEILIRMRVGGMSNMNIKNILKKTAEDYIILKRNKIGLPLLTVMLKNLRKIKQFIYPAFLRSGRKSLPETEFYK